MKKEIQELKDELITTKAGVDQWKEICFNADDYHFTMIKELHEQMRPCQRPGWRGTKSSGRTWRKQIGASTIIVETSTMSPPTYVFIGW